MLLSLKIAGVKDPHLNSVPSFMTFSTQVLKVLEYFIVPAVFLRM